MEGVGRGKRNKEIAQSNSEIVAWSLHEDTNLFQFLIVKDPTSHSEVGKNSIPFRRMDIETLKLIKPNCWDK